VDPLATKVAYRAAAIGIASALLLVAVYLAAVWTSTGQRFEDHVLTIAAAAGRSHQELIAQLMLATVRKVTLAAAIALIVAIAARRRQAYTGILGVGVVVAAALTAQVLKAVVARPILLQTGDRRDDQSFPSGHTAIAMSVNRQCTRTRRKTSRRKGRSLLR
jgi:membrane-associated phospholipid phosphatase